MPKILVVDEDIHFLKIFKQALRKIENSTVVTSNSARKALNYARSRQYDVVISDFRMRDMDAVSFLKEMRKLQPFSVRIMVSGLCDRAALRSAINEAPEHRYLEIPCQLDTICTIVKGTLSKRKQLAIA